MSIVGPLDRPDIFDFVFLPVFNKQINAVQPKMKRLNRTVIRFNLFIENIWYKFNQNIIRHEVVDESAEKLKKSFSNYKYVLTIFKSIYDYMFLLANTIMLCQYRVFFKVMSWEMWDVGGKCDRWQLTFSQNSLNFVFSLCKSRINAIQPEMKRSDRMAIRFNRAYVYYVEN